jgi:uncharacterized protein with HEPN domain
MTGGAPRLLDYLDHMKAAIDLAEQVTLACGEAEFVEGKRPLLDAAAVRQVEIIGEAAVQIRDRYLALVEAHPELPWRAMWGMRNRLIHGYFGVNLQTVWSVISRDLPTMREQLVAVRVTAEKLEPRPAERD